MLTSHGAFSQCLWGEQGALIRLIIWVGTQIIHAEKSLAILVTSADSVEGTVFMYTVPLPLCRRYSWVLYRLCHLINISYFFVRHRILHIFSSCQLTEWHKARGLRHLFKYITNWNWRHHWENSHSEYYVYIVYFFTVSPAKESSTEEKCYQVWRVVWAWLVLGLLALESWWSGDQISHRQG